MTSNLTSNEDALQSVTFWHNGICFYREYCYSMDNDCYHKKRIATDTAIVGDSFYISQNAKEKRIKKGRYSSDNDKFANEMMSGGVLFPTSNKCEYGNLRTRFTDKAAARLIELSEDSGAPISEIYARLLTQNVYMNGKGVPQIDLSRSYKAVKESLASIPPTLTCAPDDGFPPPCFPYTGNVIFIGNGWKMRHLLGHSNVAFS